MPPDDLTALLERIKERYRTSFTTLPGFSTSPGTPWAHVNSADDVPVLLVAVEAVLKLHQPVYEDYIDGDGIERASRDCAECGPPGTPDSWPCPTVRALRTALGEESGDG